MENRESLVGAKMRLKDGATCDHVDDGMIVTVECGPMNVAGALWVKFEGVDEACLLVDFERIETEPQGLGRSGRRYSHSAEHRRAQKERDVR